MIGGRFGFLQIGARLLTEQETLVASACLAFETVEAVATSSEERHNDLISHLEIFHRGSKLRYNSRELMAYNEACRDLLMTTVEMQIRATKRSCPNFQNHIRRFLNRGNRPGFNSDFSRAFEDHRTHCTWKGHVGECGSVSVVWRRVQSRILNIGPAFREQGWVITSPVSFKKRHPLLNISVE